MSIEIKIGKDTHRIEITWKVAAALAEQFADPVDVTNDIMAQTEAANSGATYEAKYPFNMFNSVKVCGIALRASGVDLTDDDVGNGAMSSREGIVGLIEAAVSIFVAIIDSDGVEVASEPGKKKSRRAGRA